jgi:hypothetical protein
MTVKRFIAGRLMVAALLCLAAIRANAQTTTATVTGVVTDQAGLVAQRASVTLTNVNTGVVSQTVTNNQGAYRISGLIPGVYREEVAQQGFKHILKDGIELHAEDIAGINFSLEVGSVSESVTVSGGEPILDTESTSLGETIEGRQVEDAPLNGRNPMNLISLTPGVIPAGSTQGAQIELHTGRYNATSIGNYSINGGIASWNTTLVDGISVNGSGANAQMFAPTQDSVAEFRVDANSPSPQYGRFAGGAISFITRSGGNKFYGTAYEYLRNTIFDANSFFNDRLHNPVSKLHQNEFGASLGGPILHEKAFFFFNWESLLEVTEGTANYRVPTPAEMGGDFTADSGATQDFLTGAQAQCNGVLNKLCPSELDPSIAAYEKLGYFLPEETNPARLAVLQASGYNADVLAKQANNLIQYVARIDYALHSKQHLFGRYTYWKSTVPLPSASGTPAVPNGPSSAPAQQVALGDNYTFTPTLNADFRVGYTRYSFNNSTAGNGHFDLSQLGPNWAALQSQLNFSAPPTFYYGNSWSYMPTAFDLDSHMFDDQYTLSTNWTLVRGKHSVQFGGEARRIEYYTTSSNNPSGNFYSPGIPAFVEGVTENNSGDTSLIQVVTPQAYEYYQGYYVTDAWHMSPKLTANIGVRWELPGVWLERKNRDAVLLPNAPNPLGNFSNPVAGGPSTLMGIIAPVSSPQYSSRAQTVNHLHLFEPRIGLNYSLNSQTVLAAGFAMAHPCLDCGGSEVASSAFETATTINPTPYTNPQGISYGLFSNPYPGGVGIPTGRSTTSMEPYSMNPQTLIGQTISGQIPTGPYAYIMQWNLHVERSIGTSTSASLSYAGSRALHLGIQAVNLNQLPDQYDSMGSALVTQVANPLYGIASPVGQVGAKTAYEAQFLMPYPEFTKVLATGVNYGESTYHALTGQLKKRFAGGSLVNVAYTWAHTISNEDSANGTFLEGLGTTFGAQDFTNHAADKSNSEIDLRQRFIFEYIYDLPFGKGQRFLATSKGLLSSVIAGWSFDGIVTYQTGFPIGLLVNHGNQLSSNFGAGTIRPNVVPGVSKKIGGSRFSRTLPGSTWFNTAAFAAPGNYSFGNESRVDSSLRGDNTENWDMNLAKTFDLTKRFKLQFKAEYFNVFNRPQFGLDTNTSTGNISVGSSTFGVISEQTNSPRIGQFSLRLNY